MNREISLIMIRILAIFVISSFFVSMSAAQTNINLTFTALNNNSSVQSDSIKVLNMSQGSDTVLYWPDTVLSFLSVGTSPELFTTPFKVHSASPNPGNGITNLKVTVPHKGLVDIVIYDITGRQLWAEVKDMEPGLHTFSLMGGSSHMMLLRAQWNGKNSSTKIISTSIDKTIRMEYRGYSELSSVHQKIKGVKAFPFVPGDQLLMIMYRGTLQTGKTDKPITSKTYTFQFDNNIPCPSAPSVTYGGETYGTIQVFSQCWMARNLNIGVKINGNLAQTNNSIIEKYCHNDDSTCEVYGGFYQWNEMMQYTNLEGSQGICPPGWHLPTSDEWRILEGSVDSYYGIADTVWDIQWFFRGFDVGTNLKSASGWQGGGYGLDLFGFCALPGGWLWNGASNMMGQRGTWWTSSSDNTSPGYAWSRELDHADTRISNFMFNMNGGKSIRCVLDD